MRRLAGILFIAVFSLSAIASGQGNEQDGKGIFAKGKWRIEVQAGWSLVDPGDLNLFPKFQETSFKFYNDQSHDYFHQKYGANYVYTVNLDPGNFFRELKKALPLAMAIRYRLGRRLDLSLGISYLTGSAKSHFGARFDIQASPPDSYGTWGYDEDATHEIDSDMAITVKAWLPAAGLHYAMPLSRRFDAEIFFSTGPLFAACDYSYFQSFKRTILNGYWIKFEYDNHLTGSGTGIAAAAGAGLRYKISSRFELFTAASYSYRYLAIMRGSADYKHRFSDSEMQTPGYTQKTYRGTWGVYWFDASNSWGVLHHERPDVFSNPRNIPRYFHLDLSGFQLQLGIACKL